ncbi:MAG TPA: tetratricopeptide repeat protein [Vicinamibacterales bacterium]|nr:tetratricopeptide repeat protein [Vicinamibacterales bacterium]
MSVVGLIYQYGVFLQAIAIVHFIRRRPETFWLWVILIGGGIGALVYIAAEVLPDFNLLRGSVNQFSRRRRIRALEAIILENAALGNREELADLYLEEGQFARARELYDSVITPRLDSLDPYYRRGIAELGLGDAAAAILDLERVIAADPKYDFHRAIGLLAHAHSLAGDPERADRLFKDATTISTLSETYYNYALFLSTRQRTSEAREWAQRILAKKPTMPGYLRRRERPWFRKAKALLKKLPA